MRRVGLDQPWRTARGHGGVLDSLSAIYLASLIWHCGSLAASAGETQQKNSFFSCTSNNFFSFGLKVIIFNRILDKFHGMYYLFCLCNGL